MIGCIRASTAAAHIPSEGKQGLGYHHLIGIEKPIKTETNNSINRSFRKLILLE